MIQIDEVLVSLDLAERFFCCDLEACKGQCCIEGDSGAPVTEAEAAELQQAARELAPCLLPEARKRIQEAGVAYVDCEGDLVTQLVDNRNCVFATRGDSEPDKICLCAVDAAFREGRCCVRKPISCALYPLRLTEYPTFTAVNYHRWDICRPAERLGREKGIRLYQFMKEPLVRRFGQDWYDELCIACQMYLEENPSK